MLHITNFTKSVKNLCTGRHFASFSQYYDARYPPTKFLFSDTCALDIRCILSGFPRSGTNWIKHVVESSTGMQTGNLGAHKPDTGTVALLKIHARSKAVARAKALWLLPRHRFGGRYIYTYRDPRDAIISLYEMYRLKKDRSDLSPETFLKLYDPIGQFRWEFDAWVKKKPRDVLTIKYEALKAQPLEGFQQIFDYIGITAPVDESAIDKPVNQVETNAKRPRRTAYGWRSAPPEYQSLIQRVSDELAAEIQYLNYDSTP